MFLDSGLRIPCTTRPIRIMASLASHAKRAAFQLGTTELYMEPASPCITFVQLLLGRARSDALSFGDFSLCEQRKVARTLDASGKAVISSDYSVDGSAKSIIDLARTLDGYAKLIGLFDRSLDGSAKKFNDLTRSIDGDAKASTDIIRSLDGLVMPGSLCVLFAPDSLCALFDPDSP